MREVFKVVKNLYGILESAIIGDQEWRVIYLPNKWVLPRVKISKLTCFDTLNHAIAFIKHCSGFDFEIWKADALHAEKAYYLADYIPSFSFYNFWNNIDALLLWRAGKLPQSPLEFSEILEPPLGTLYADGLRLTNKIDLEILRENE